MKASVAAVAAGSLLGSAAANIHGKHAGIHNRRNAGVYTYNAYESSSSSAAAYESSSLAGYAYSSSIAAYPTPSYYGSASGVYWGTAASGYPVGTGYPAASSSVWAPTGPYGYDEEEGATETCGCTTYTTTWYGEATLVDNYTPPAETVYVTPVPASSEVLATAYSSVVPYVTPSSTCELPTPIVTVCPTTGIYTIPASTVTITESTEAIYTTTAVCSEAGACSYGGVVTSVMTSTTVTCPYVSTYVHPTESTTTSIITSTTYVCPSAGVYTVVPHTTTTVASSTTCSYPEVTPIIPGTYTAPESTITVTETSYTYTCPFETVAPSSSVLIYTAASAYSTPAVYSSYAEKTETVATIYSTPVEYTSVIIETPYSTPVETSYATPTEYTVATYETTKPTHSKTHKAPKPSNTGSSYSGGISTNGNQWAMTYTPYTSSGECRTASEVMSDISAIKGYGFTTVRLYATDCSGLINVGAAAEKYGMRMIIGIFIDSAGIPACTSQVDEIIAWGKFELVDMIVIGNEAVFNGYCTASELASFITSCKSKFQGAGYTGPCTTTETLNILQEYGSELCGAIDVVAANIQAYFNSGVSASDAGDFVASQLELVGECCPGLDAYNLESGWPSQGSANGAAVAGYAEQKTAIEGILAKTGGKSVIFSYENDSWKDAGEFGVEQYFGCSSIF